jgi:A/G-specific adenine glycosylase
MRAREIACFRKKVYAAASRAQRLMPWRDDHSSYAVFISEVMLQQTQVARVLIKYPPFIAHFPGFAALAGASLSDVMTLWEGLGYNRRAKHLRDAARIIVDDFGGECPRDIDTLRALPGIGRNTAAAICVYAFNDPVPYIETNIRSVYIHHFFKDRGSVHDNDILPLVHITIDRENPRRWFWALMDYGTILKKTEGNAARKSTSHRVQKKFSGSDRMIRGMIIRAVTRATRLTYEDLSAAVGNDPRAEKLATSLVREGLLLEERGTYLIGK